MIVNRGNGVGQQALAKRLAELKGRQAAVGWLATAKYPNGTPVAYAAVIAEFGNPANNQPPRSFVRVTQNEKGAGWSVLIAKGAKRVMEGSMTTDAMYEAIGLQIAGDIRATLARGEFAELAESTIAIRAKKRGLSVEEVNKDPLHDSGYMQSSLTSVVTDAGEIP